MPEKCGQRFSLAIRNDTYYNTSKIGLVAGESGGYLVKMDLIATVAVTMDNSSTLAVATRGQNTTITGGTGASHDVKFNLKANTAQGALRFNPGVI